MQPLFTSSLVPQCLASSRSILALSHSILTPQEISVFFFSFCFFCTNSIYNSVTTLSYYPLAPSRVLSCSHCLSSRIRTVSHLAFTLSLISCSHCLSSHVRTV